MRVRGPRRILIGSSGYAESRDLLNWKVIKGIDNPIISTAPFTIAVDGAGHPMTGGTPVTVPSSQPVAGGTSGFFQERVYAPSAAISGEKDLTVIFAGYHTPKPKNGLGDYRTIGRVSLHSSRKITGASTSTSANDDGRECESDE